MGIFSVSQFIEFLNTSLSAAVFPEGVIVEGEVAEYRVSQDKWIWFLLKDDQSLISCFATVWQLRTPLEDGMQIRIMGTPKVHPKSGKFSVTVEQVELVGEGALRRAFELLKKKLSEEGLFASERKRPIPRFPERIGLITSREAAAYTDFLRILKNRWGGVEVHAAHVQVQGRDAVHDIVGAFTYFNHHSDLVDVLVLTRGGGSLEDLQAFNSEEVARAVFGSVIPVVVGVGHERDETLVDFVADMRASTPTNAAELVVPNRHDILRDITGSAQRIALSFGAQLSRRTIMIQRMEQVMERHAQRGIEAVSQVLRDFGRHFALFTTKISGFKEGVAHEVAIMSDRLRFVLNHGSQEVLAKERLLQSLDPKRVLARGYAVVRSSGAVLKDAQQVDIGAVIEVQLQKGRIDAKVVHKTA